jgi:hypothetical protein
MSRTVRAAISLLGCTVVVAVAACGGSGSADKEGVATTGIANGAGVAACWKDAAEQMRAATALALTVLREDFPAAGKRFDAVRRTGAAGDTQAFDTAVKRFFQSLERLTTRGTEFERRERDASAVLSECETAGEAGAAQVDACWKEATTAYQTAAQEAKQALGPGAGEFFFAVQTVVRAGETGDPADRRRAEKQMAAALAKMEKARRSLERTAQKTASDYEDCAAA